jgi:NADP-dependent 3-hydroxy acid dehydrogenase YdfG
MLIKISLFFIKMNKMNNFKDKVVIVTGSSMGIGKALATELAKKGATIVLNGRNIDRLEKVHQKMKSDTHMSNLEHLEVSQEKQGHNLQGPAWFLMQQAKIE